MTKFAVAAIASVVAGLAAAPAVADYDIAKDPAFPSVVYIEFDPSTLPVVYTLPEDPALPVIGGGTVDTQGGSTSNARPSDNGSRSNSSSSETLSLNERAQNKVEELVNSSPVELENKIIDREIEDQVMDDLMN
jgi:hypothetical protein